MKDLNLMPRELGLILMMAQVKTLSYEGVYRSLLKRDSMHETQHGGL